MEDYNKDNYVVKLVLTSFWGGRTQLVENENGDLEECVCIPLDRNDLKKNKRGQVTAYAFMTQATRANMYGWTHYLKPKVNPNFLKKLNEQGYANPYIGNAKKGNFIIYKNLYKDKFVKVSNDE